MQVFFRGNTRTRKFFQPRRSGFYRSSLIKTTVGNAAGVATVSGIGAGIFPSTGQTDGSASVLGVGVGIIAAVGASAGSATVTGEASSISVGVGSAFGAATVTGFAEIQPITSTNVLQFPVDCVLAGQQREFKTGRAHFGALRGIFRE